MKRIDIQEIWLLVECKDILGHFSIMKSNFTLELLASDEK